MSREYIKQFEQLAKSINPLLFFGVGFRSFYAKYQFLLQLRLCDVILTLITVSLDCSHELSAPIR